MTIEELTKGIKNCSCGSDHTCPIKTVRIGAGALADLPSLCLGYKKIVLVADDNTWRACGNEVADMLSYRISSTVILHSDGVVIPDEKAIKKIRKAAEGGADLYIGVGSGVINDLCKHVSYELGLPYYIVATAPSMDGYASVGSALILDGMKVTLDARPPMAIIAEQRVIRNAPLRMLQAGYGDIIGKFSCLNDWKLSALLNGEKICDEVWQLTYDTAEKVRPLGKRILARDGEAVSELMTALVVTGIAMSYVGNSRPASGSEHHLSHYFEITGILDGKPYLPHGIDVACSSVVTASVRKRIMYSEPEKRPFDREAYESEIKRIYGVTAKGVMDLQYGAGAYTRYTPAAEMKDKVRSLLAESPGPEDFLAMLESAGISMKEYIDLYGAEKIKDGVLYAKDLKNRYTVLNLYYDYYRGNEEWINELSV